MSDEIKRAEDALKAAHGENTTSLVEYNALLSYATAYSLLSMAKSLERMVARMDVLVQGDRK